MPSLRFRTNRVGNDFGIVVPLELRNPDFTFLRSAATGQTVTVQEGEYVIVAQFPGGHQVSKLVRATAEPVADVVFDVPKGASEMTLSGYRSMYVPAATADHDRRAGSILAKVESISVFPEREGHQAIEDWPARKELPTHLEFGFRPNERRFCTVSPVRNRPITLALPGYFLLPCIVEFLVDQDGQLSTIAHPQNQTADSLVGSLRAGEWSAAVALFGALESQAETLVHGKREDPIAATIGAFVLLRVGKTSALSKWAELLDQYRPWLPDARIVRAECEARQFRHDQAFQLFASLPVNVTPMFTDSLRYAITRLRQYLDDRNPFSIDKELAGIASRVYDRLQKLASFADLREPILTLVGADVDIVG